MRIEEFLAMKKGDMKEYSEVLKKKEKLERKLRVLSFAIQDEEDAIYVITHNFAKKDDYKLSIHKELLQKHRKQSQKAAEELARLSEEIQENFLKPT